MLNKVILVGRLTADPEIKTTTTGISVTTFSLALNKGDGKAEFFTVVAWRNTAEFICKYFHKGDGICIDGHLASRQYEKDGVKHTAYEVVCDNVGFAEGRNKGEGNEITQPRAKTSQNANMDDFDKFVEISTDENLLF